ncbi:MAG: 4Fe-4S binding protein [Lachnospiraceae bacterium]|nr:4Fe-4S binding protein [Lachnospiraceae bacterium]
MELYSDKENCCGCGACADVCPAGAVRMVSDGEGFRYPKIDQSKCVNCGRCERVCPMKKASAGTGENLYFGVQAKDDALRHASSSGGMFPVLAEYIFRQGGIVCGAAFGDEMRVVHREAGTKEELESLKKTKYVQSNMEGMYRRIDGYLKEGRWVLFCGTPCQVRALKLFLNKEYPQLLLAALICYGVPSPGIWDSYVKYLERKHGGKMTDFSFRDKRNRDNGHVRAYTIDGKEYADKLEKDLYCQMYFRNDTLRPSCHTCGYCTTDRDCDFTIGDFWGVEKIRPEADDGMGTSLVILHTEKAGKVWEEIKGELFQFPCEREEILQPRLTAPTTRAKGRGIYMALYKLLPASVFFTLYAVSACCIGYLRRLCKK